MFRRVAQLCSCVWSEEDRKFIDRWTAWRGDSLERVDAGMRGTARSDSYVAEVCWEEISTSNGPRRWGFTGCEACCDAASTFFHANQSLLASGNVGFDPVTGAGLGDKYHLQDRMKCSVPCWTNE